jgi:transcription elongation factor Elf1
LTDTVRFLDLSASVDVYSDWVDACDAVAKDTADQFDAPNTSQPRGIKPDIQEGDTYDDDY